MQMCTGGGNQTVHDHGSKQTWSLWRNLLLLLHVFLSNILLNITSCSKLTGCFDDSVVVLLLLAEIINAEIIVSNFLVIDRHVSTEKAQRSQVSTDRR